jgi:hypothetical protein
MAKHRSPNPPRPADMPTGVAAGRVEGGSRAGPEHRVLDALIGRWLTEGHTLAGAGVAAAPILASDVYEWEPGGFFIHHSAYGRVGGIDVGGTENHRVESGERESQACGVGETIPASAIAASGPVPPSSSCLRKTNASFHG